MTAASRWADGLFEMLTGHTSDAEPSPNAVKCVVREPFIRRLGSPYCILHDYAPGAHSDCIVNTCRVCANLVTNGQISDGDAHPDSGDAETWVHRECAQGEKYGD